MISKNITSNGRNVKNNLETTTDAHEKIKNYLSEKEVNLILNATKTMQEGIRNYLIILMMYRHGLRVSEAINLKISNINLAQSRIWINRLKNGLSVEHPIAGDELRAIKRYLKTREDMLPWLFTSNRNQPLTRQSINAITLKSSQKAGLEKVNPHMLRHSCGFYLANKGYDLRLIQDYLGHRDPKHTTIYTRVASHRFQNLW